MKQKLTLKDLKPDLLEHLTVQIGCRSYDSVLICAVIDRLELSNDLTRTGAHDPNLIEGLLGEILFAELENML